jgi:hypothetical protein
MELFVRLQTRRHGFNRVFSSKVTVMVWYDKVYLPIIDSEFSRHEADLETYSHYTPLWLLLNRLDTLPSAAQPLLPQAHPVVAGADGQGVAAQAPAHAPCDGVDL